MIAQLFSMPALSIKNAPTKILKSISISTGQYYWNKSLSRYINKLCLLESVKNIYRLNYIV